MTTRINNNSKQETIEMIGETHAQSDGPDTDQEQLDLEMQRVQEVSPEGRPAHPELKNKNMMFLMGCVVGSFLLVSFVVYLFYGLAPAALIMVFGTAIACLGNPVFWSLPLRAEEREEVEHQVNN